MGYLAALVIGPVAWAVRRARISEVQIANALCCGIGALAAYNAYYIIKYWGVIVSLWGEATRWLDAMGSL